MHRHIRCFSHIQCCLHTCVTPPTSHTHLPPEDPHLEPPENTMVLQHKALSHRKPCHEIRYSRRTGVTIATLQRRKKKTVGICLISQSENVIM